MRLSASSSPGVRIDASSFVGRAMELATLRRHLEQGARLVTVVGTFGVGKTRIARRFGRLCALHGARLWRCDLASATSDRDLVVEVARSLGVSFGLEHGVSGMIERIGLAMAACGSGAMFVLDSFDPVVEHAATTLGPWLALAPGATFLVTCRQPLGLEAERCLRVSPLPQADGETLFHDRMLAGRGAATLVEGDRACIAEIVRKLDGIPLAIEMAAARTTMMRPAEILQRIPARFELLRSERRDAPARHATLALAIGWSWDALTPWERSALGQCATFQGRFSVTAAEAIVEVADHPDAPPVLDILQCLVARSLLETASTVEDGDDVYLGLGESLREYAIQRLDVATARAASVRHARYCLSWTEPLADMVEREDSRAALAELGREFDVLAALLIARDRGDTPRATLEVAGDGRWFRVRPADPVVLGRHIVLRRLLVALASHSVERLGEPIPAVQLIACVWPDERIEARAAMNRLHNAISVLRSKGLRGILRTTDEGYRFDSLVVLVKVDLAVPE